MKNVSILGCGWLGLALGSSMADRGFNVKGSVTNPEKIELLKASKISPCLFNWSSQDIPSEFLDCDIMIMTIPPSTPNYKINFINFINLLENKRISKVFYTSTSSVYPDNNGEVTEEDAEKIVSPHSGIALLEIEDMLRNNDFFHSTIVRFSGLYGPGRLPGKFLAGKKNLSGANKPVNLIHREDCIEVIIRLIEQNMWQETFNACSDYHPTRKEFYQAACLKQNLEPPT
ncbi:MAG: NAD(P)H-binding protein, partial [Bacteroidota bacterium]